MEGFKNDIQFIKEIAQSIKEQTKHELGQVVKYQDEWNKEQLQQQKNQIRQRLQHKIDKDVKEAILNLNQIIEKEEQKYQNEIEKIKKKNSYDPSYLESRLIGAKNTHEKILNNKINLNKGLIDSMKKILNQ